ncbi:PfkB family carbohydrate kinase [Nesterenkonia sphaerica]|nr:PfkB family carbohydrate kinase [Nesterenkonia sphaerica]
MTAATPALVVFGSVNQDVMLQVSEFPEPGQTVTARAVTRATGGKGANQAVAAALQGTATRMIGAVGDDAGGTAARAALQAAGVQTAELRRCAGAATGTAYISVRTDGENTIVVEPGANAQLSAADPSEESLAGARWALLSLEVPEAEAFRFAARAKAYGVQVALNASPALEGSLPEGLIDVLIVNEVEILDIAGAGWKQTADLAAAVGVQAVVVTRGGEGVDLFRRGQLPLHQPAEPAQVQDTTGCGGCVRRGHAGGADPRMQRGGGAGPGEYLRRPRSGAPRRDVRILQGLAPWGPVSLSGPLSGAWR